MHCIILGCCWLYIFTCAVNADDNSFNDDNSPPPNGDGFHSEFWGNYHSEKWRNFPESERLKCKDSARKMFYFGYDSYMKYAFPQDELNPIACSGRGPDVLNP